MTDSNGIVGAGEAVFLFQIWVGVFSKHFSCWVGREVAAPLQLPNQQSALERRYLIQICCFYFVR